MKPPLKPHQEQVHQTGLMHLFCFLFVFSLSVLAPSLAQEVDATTLRGKAMCGYQGWFRCPGDAADMGWVHWSRDARRLAPDTLSFEMWPDMTEYSAGKSLQRPALLIPTGKQPNYFPQTMP